MLIKKYVKKPIVVEAMQWTGDNFDDLVKFAGPNVYRKLVAGNPLFVKTLEGDMLSIQGDYIIKGIAGEFYSCKEDIFYKTYDILSEVKTGELTKEEQAELKRLEEGDDDVSQK